jgi:DNA-binding PadR family transcriptional regulator
VIRDEEIEDMLEKMVADGSAEVVMQNGERFYRLTGKGHQEAEDLLGSNPAARAFARGIEAGSAEIAAKSLEATQTTTQGPYKPHWPFDSYPKDEATWQKAVQVYESLLAQVDELKAAHAPAVSEEKCRHDRAEELEAVLWNIANPPKGCAPDWGQKIAKAVLSEKARPATSGGEDGK